MWSISNCQICIYPWNYLSHYLTKVRQISLLEEMRLKQGGWSFVWNGSTAANYKLHIKKILNVLNKDCWTCIKIKVSKYNGQSSIYNHTYSRWPGRAWGHKFSHKNYTTLLAKFDTISSFTKTYWNVKWYLKKKNKVSKFTNCKKTKTEQLL